MVAVIPFRAREYQRIYQKQYGHGFGSFLKNTLTKAVSATKTGLKAAGKVALKTGKAAAKAAATHLAPIAKDVLNQAKQTAISVGQQALASAVAGGQQLVAEHGARLVDALANAQNLGDLKSALSDTAKGALTDAKTLAKDVLAETKANAKQGLKDTAIYAVKTTLGLPTVVADPGDNGDGAEGDYVAEGDGDYGEEATNEEGGGLRRGAKGTNRAKGGSLVMTHRGGGGKGKKPLPLSQLLAQAELGHKPRKAKARGQKGGAAFIPYSSATYG